MLSAKLARRVQSACRRALSLFLAGEMLFLNQPFAVMPASFGSRGTPVTSGGGISAFVHQVKRWALAQFQRSSSAPSQKERNAQVRLIEISPAHAAVEPGQS